MRALALLCALASIAASAPPDAKKVIPEAEFEVVRAELVLVHGLETKEPRFEATTKVPHKPGQSFGWVIELRTQKPKIKWREEFALPEAPQTWGPTEKEDKRRISDDKKVSVIEREVEPGRGLIYNFWTLAAGDPPGRYVIRVFIEGVRAATFEFDVE
ncbi:MAG TPA: hypothetical protein VN747_05305 [Burkholderiales bacterium]|nr:hypothetical protein [Burkholderiales bacterium]